MSDENNVQPAFPDIVRSMLPYLLGRKSDVAGRVSIDETDSGQKFAIYTPPGYDTSLDNYPIVYHLHGAGMFWSWMVKELYWIAAAQERAVAAGKTRPMVIVSPHDESKFSIDVVEQDFLTIFFIQFRDDLAITSGS